MAWLDLVRVCGVLLDDWVNRGCVDVLVVSKFTYGEYGFSSIGTLLYSTIREGCKNKIVLHSLREVKCNQAYTPGVFHEVYNILELPILMIVISLVVSFEPVLGSLSASLYFSFKYLPWFILS